jgi:L-ascorbate metabolism protein UlaG (beta-lactamase superfamily)
MIKRRTLLHYAGAAFLTAAGTPLLKQRRVIAQTPEEKVTVEWLGHTCFLFTSNGTRILVNPFRALGCTAGYEVPKVPADIVLISSQLLDEGAADLVPGNPKVFYEPGIYQVNGLQIQGIAIDHDREGGRRFGTNVAWQWEQGGINILHLGGAAAPITIEQKILMGRPDLALIPVGGGVKAYNAEEATAAIQVLKPKVVIPTHYRTEAADEEACELADVGEFLKLTEDIPSSLLNTNQIAIRPQDLPETSSVIRVMSY